MRDESIKRSFELLAAASKEKELFWKGYMMGTFASLGFFLLGKLSTWILS